MIGQTRLKEQIERQWETDKFPSFAIFVGPRGCGKRTMIKEIVKDNNLIFSEIPTTVDGVRELQYLINRSSDVVYSINNIDSLSQAGCNALLKIAEEHDDNTIIATCENIENVPTTIRSRAVVYQFDEYTQDELCDFCEERGYEVTDFVMSVCETPGDIEELNKYDIEEFRNFIFKVIENVASVSGANAFKIADKICIKSDEGYDLKLFLKAFSSICVDYMMDKDVNNSLKFAKAVAITGNILADLNIKSINKQMLFDTWLLDVRSAWS